MGNQSMSQALTVKQNLVDLLTEERSIAGAGLPKAYHDKYGEELEKPQGKRLKDYLEEAFPETFEWYKPDSEKPHQNVRLIRPAGGRDSAAGRGSGGRGSGGRGSADRVADLAEKLANAHEAENI